MAIDYYLEIEQYGTQENRERLHHIILDMFSLTNHGETGIMTGIGLGVSIFEDYDEFSEDNKLKSVPDLVINFRVEKNEYQEQGYRLLHKIVQKVFDLVDVDMQLKDENDEHIFLKKESGCVSKFFPEHDFWQVGVDSNSNRNF